MIQIKSNIDTLIKNNKKRIKKIEKAGIQSHKLAANEAKLIAIQLAPKKGGGIVNNIRVEHKKKYSKVISSVQKSFPYQFWVNETSPYKSIKLIPHFRPRGKKKQIVFYYREVAKTGIPRYFDIASEIVSKKFPKLTFTLVHKALKETATTGGSLK